MKSEIRRILHMLDGISLTICLALKCKILEKKQEIPSVLFASDTQESGMFLKRPVTKLRTVYSREPENKETESWRMLIASSGDAMIADEVFDDIMLLLRKSVRPDDQCPSACLSVWRKEIGDLAYTSFKKFKDRGDENPYFEFLIGIADDFPMILRVTYEGKTQMLEDYGIIGSGRVTGGELLIRELFEKDMTEDDAALLAALMISTVGHVDISVGGEPDMRICRARSVWAYEEDAYRRILENSESRWRLMKSAWKKMKEDAGFESELKELLKK